MTKLPLSVAIITFNEEENIGRTLESMADIASEIIIIDSGSTDNTLKIVEKYGAKIFSETWKGHIGQKNSALDKCSQKWLFSLDADEVVSDEFKTQDILFRKTSQTCLAARQENKACKEKCQSGMEGIKSSR